MTSNSFFKRRQVRKRSPEQQLFDEYNRKRNLQGMAMLDSKWGNKHHLPGMRVRTNYTSLPTKERKKSNTFRQYDMPNNQFTYSTTPVLTYSTEQNEPFKKYSQPEKAKLVESNLKNKYEGVNHADQIQLKPLNLT